jgi:transposase InsO family protein
MEPNRILRRERSYLAKLLGVSLRTIELWADERRVPSLRPPGRPRASREERRLALHRVRDELLRQGKSAGWRPVLCALTPLVSTRQAQASVSALKRCWRRRERAASARRRMRVEVLARDALWAQDATQVGRVEGEAVLAEVVRDAATTTTSAHHVGAPASGADVRRVLEAEEAKRGALPLVYAVDNGGAYRADELCAWLEQHQIIVLRNVPHVPQHNAFAERANGELKAETGLRSDLVLRDPGDALTRIQAALPCLYHRRRTSRGGRTAAELDVTLTRAEAIVSRDTFWRTTRYNIARAVQGVESPRAQRLAERAAILETMESFGLIRRTRGGVPLAAVKSEGVL